MAMTSQTAIFEYHCLFKRGSNGDTDKTASSVLEAYLRSILGVSSLPVAYIPL
jgi:hypothetical protein